MIRSGQSVFSQSHKYEADRLSLTVPSEAKYIREASSKILNALTKYNVAEDRAFDIRLCVEEAMRNAMVHGNRSDIRLPVMINSWIKDGCVFIEIEDKGKGYNHKILPDPTKTEHIYKYSGRGVYLIKKLMDRVEFNERGNRIRMIKKI